MIATDNHISRAIVLRDFFLAENRSEMELSCQPLFKASQLPNPTVDEWCELEFAFNQLFVGPRSVFAPPFASVYLDEDRYVMGESTQSVRKIYQMIGLASPWEGKLPDDHISLELDACQHLHDTIERTDYSPLMPVYDYFLNSHMKTWVPAFRQKIQEMPDVPGLFEEIGNLLFEWLQDECEWLSKCPIHESESLFLNKEGVV